MDHNLPLAKLLPQFFVSGAEVFDPYRRVCENQAGPNLRRGIFFNFGMVPPRQAHLRALSRPIRALRACRSNAPLSAPPVNSRATRTISSSSATGVLIDSPGAN